MMPPPIWSGSGFVSLKVREVTTLEPATVVVVAAGAVVVIPVFVEVDRVTVVVVTVVVLVREVVMLVTVVVVVGTRSVNCTERADVDRPLGFCGYTRKKSRDPMAVPEGIAIS